MAPLPFPLHIDDDDDVIADVVIAGDAVETNDVDVPVVDAIVSALQLAICSNSLWLSSMAPEISGSSECRLWKKKWQTTK